MHLHTTAQYGALHCATLYFSVLVHPSSLLMRAQQHKLDVRDALLKADIFCIFSQAPLLVSPLTPENQLAVTLNWSHDGKVTEAR